MRRDFNALDVSQQPVPRTSLEACDESQDLDFREEGYCPVQLLNQFTLLMAGHGRCINTAMMLADREYAMWQLARAYATDDRDLRALASRLFPWLDERSHH
jgi:hypothetical protein